VGYYSTVKIAISGPDVEELRRRVQEHADSDDPLSRYSKLLLEDASSEEGLLILEGCGKFYDFSGELNEHRSYVGTIRKMFPEEEGFDTAWVRIGELLGDIEQVAGDRLIVDVDVLPGEVHQFDPPPPLEERQGDDKDASEGL